MIPLLFYTADKQPEKRRKEMKQTYELTAQPIFTGLLSWVVKKEDAEAFLRILKHKIRARLPGHRQILITGAATLFLSCLFLGGSYLFFTQLAAYGW